jgi:hypothetical protein
MSSAKVFLVQNTRLNSANLSEFGECVALLGKKVPMKDLSGTALLMAKRLKEEEFNCDSDYIAISGNIALVSILSSIALAGFPSINVLMFDAHSSRYRPHTIINPFML